MITDDLQAEDTPGGVTTEATIKLFVGDDRRHRGRRGQRPGRTRSTGRCGTRSTAGTRRSTRVHLTDYKVRVLDTQHGTGAITRVLLDSHRRRRVVDDDRRQREHHRGELAGPVGLDRLRLAPSLRTEDSKPPCPPTRTFPSPSTKSRARSRTSRPAATCRRPARGGRTAPATSAPMQPKGAFLGSPGPNVGYALTLANRAKDRFELEPHESVDDAVAVVAALAMKRAATFGRAPTINDVDFAMELLGYRGEVPDDVREWRPDVVREAAHDYVGAPRGGRHREHRPAAPADLRAARAPRRRCARRWPGRPRRPRAAEGGEDVDLGEVRRRRRRPDDDAARPRPRVSDAEPPRVRFSPAPTGFLHVGGVRTALFNWLFARHHGGTFILRIEDTDIARTRERVDRRHPGHAALARASTGTRARSSRATVWTSTPPRRPGCSRPATPYECYCTPEEVKARSDAAMKAGRPPGYDGTVPRPHRRRAARPSAGPRAGRSRCGSAPRTPGSAAFTDLVRGEVSVEWSTISDFVIVRSDGSPVFFLANAVDDADMEITHVIRGEDLLDTDPPRARAAGRARHHRIRSSSRTCRCSSGRTGASSRSATARSRSRTSAIVATSPDALVNYLALLGWAPADGREVLTRDEMVAEFDLDRVTHSAAFFDYKKLDWLNGEYIRALSARRAHGPRVRHRARAVGRPGRPASGPRGRANRTGAGGDRSSRSSTRPTSCSSPTPTSRWSPRTGTRSSRRPTAPAEVLDAVIAHLETCDWTVELTDVRPPIDGARHQAAQGDAAALHRGRGTPSGPPAVRLDPSARPRAEPRAARARPGPGSARIPKSTAG